tara:strand:+ start:2207 stop:2599 length:393 start_codon:yes stop_codon:yes gene_type:complete
MPKKIFTEISLGELLDKISILEIKLKKIKDKSKIFHIKKEYNILLKIKKKVKVNKKVNIYYKKLKAVNNSLWNIEDKIRLHEKLKKFDKKFILLARRVYFTNDKRSKIKLSINMSMNSNIIEMKSYSKYN